MSHVVSIKTALTDPTVLASACVALGIPAPKLGTFKLYAASKTGIGIQLPGWHYPIVVAADGSIDFDNYNGSWGAQEQLDKLVQRYGVEKAKLELMRSRNRFVGERTLEDGSIELVFQS